MQVQNKNYQFPLYESAILKKQRQSRHLSPKVTQMYPGIQKVQKINIKRHHLDDTEMYLFVYKRKEALYYDYEEYIQPKQYFFKGEKLQYSQKNIQKFNKQPLVFKNNPMKETLSSQYFDRQLINNYYQRPEKDIKTKFSNSRKKIDRDFFLTENQTKLKKSASTMDFQSLQQMENKILSKLSKLQSQNDQISQYLIENKAKFSLNSTEIQRYKSENKKYSVNQPFRCFKNKLLRQQSKENQKLKNQIIKVKQQTKKLKKQEVQRSQSFRSNKNRANKSVQCDFHDSGSDFRRKVISKPPFLFDSQSNTDSQFSDF